MPIVESGGQSLTIGAIADGEYVKRAGTGLTSGSPGGGQAFPVGAVFIAVVATDPNTLLGYGTWAAIAAGRVLVGLNAGDADFDTAEETGGAKTVASAGTVASIAASATAALKVGTSASNAADKDHTHPAPAFTGSATSVVQPYLVVYMWKRTA
jgi:hypothetical protein